MTRMLRRLVPMRLLPLARFIYHLPWWFTPPILSYVKGRIAFKLANRPTHYEAALLARNAKFKDMHAGRRCFVIGNGPSLNRQDLSPLGNEMTIVMNRFNQHPIIEKWKPTFFCMADPAENLRRVDLTSFIDKIEAKAYFFQIDVKEIIDERRIVDQEKVFYLRMGSVLQNAQMNTKYNIDFTRAIPRCISTAHMALMLAIYMGCSPIYLIGLDHDYLAHRSIETHFYAGGGDLSQKSYKWYIKSTLLVWELYEWIQSVAREKGITIYNATAGGFLDVFPRAEYESLFSPRADV
jgi:hypothetical protein